MNADGADLRGTILIVGVGGGTGSGKTTFAEQLQRRLPAGIAQVLSHDSYYRDLSHLPPEQRASVNFDDPASLETELLVEHLRCLRRNEPIAIPSYSFATHSRIGSDRVAPTPVVIVEGILVLSIEVLREQFDLKIYVDAPPDIRVARRMVRDIRDRGRTAESVDLQYRSSVRPMHELHVEPSRAFADVIVPGVGDFSNALRMTADALRHRLRLRDG
ncbi:MAG: uridine kinase [Planctomycetota bacterium]